MKECQLCKNCYADDVANCPKDGMPTMHTLAGEPILEGKYQLESRLGQGGMGVVYKARHAYLKTQLAIKIILPDLVGNDPQLVTRFRQEALAAAAIRHQNVVAVTDYGVIAGSIPFLVMEYVEGESLHDLLAREKKLGPEETLDLITAISAGVGAAHHQGIVHRDLKPLNIMTIPAAWSFDTMKRFSTLETLEPEGANPRDRTKGLGLYKFVESENEKALEKSKKDLDTLKQISGGSLQTGDPSIADELVVPEMKKVPDDLSGYVTFLHPCHHSICSGSPSCQQSNTTRPSRRDGKSTRPRE